MKRVQLRRGTLLLGITTVLLASCSSVSPQADDTSSPAPAETETASPAAQEPESPDDSEPAGELTPVRITTNGNDNSVPVMVALERGLFVANGLDAQVTFTQSAGDAALALEGGETDVAMTSASALSSYVAGGGDVAVWTVLAGRGQDSGFTQGHGIVGRAGSGISEDPQSLVGQTVATGVGGSTHHYLLGYLEANGLSDADIEILNVPPPEGATAYIDGLVDAYSSGGQFLIRAHEGVDDSVLLSHDEPFVSFVTGLMSQPDWLAENQDVAVSVMQTLAEAVLAMREDKAAAMEDASRYIDNLDISVFDQTFFPEDYDPRVTVCTMESFRRSMQQALEAGAIEEPIDPSSVYTTEITDAASQAAPDTFTQFPEPPATADEC